MINSLRHIHLLPSNHICTLSVYGGAVGILILLLGGCSGLPDRDSHDRLTELILSKIDSLPPDERSHALNELSKWFPDLHYNDPVCFAGSECSGLAAPVMKEISVYVSRLARRYLANGRPATAGMEAFKALCLYPGNAEASDVLGYENGSHPIASDLRREGKVRTRWGWLPAEQARCQTPSPVPDGTSWQAEDVEILSIHVG